MRNVWWVLAVLATAVPAWGQEARVFDIKPSGAIAEVPLSLAVTATGHTIELRNVDAGANALVHVLGSNGAEVAGKSAINSAAVDLPPDVGGKSLTLLVRSQSDGAYHADIWVDGKVFKRAVAFSRGASVALPGLAQGEEVVAIRPPLGLATHRAYLLTADGSRVLARTSGPETTLSTRTTGDAIALYSAPGTTAAGALRVLRNDRATDADGDGLGDRLEAALGTCASRLAQVPGVSCRALADPRDTDGDGLWDSWETMGKSQSVGGTWVTVPLPTWGANPRHKDIFVEVDYRRLTQQDNQQGVTERMSPMVARQVAATYADQATTDAAMRVAHAQDVGNPDGQPGISLHFDTGVGPQTPADATIYGDWGGYTAVDAVPDGSGGFRPQTPGEAIVNNFSAARLGLFHYVLGYTSGGGSCGVGIACGFNMASAGNSAHEFGHTLWLDHNGPAGTHEPNCKPNYPSLMNYAYLGSGFVQFSDGRGFPALNNHAVYESGDVDNNPVWLNVLRSVFGYRVDMATGNVDWNRDGAFQPPNVPVRAYANFRPYDSGGCEYTREGEVTLPVKSHRSPAVIRYNGLIWVFTVSEDHKLEYSYTPSAWTCPNVDDCPAPTFPYHAVHDVGPVDAVDAAAINVNGTWVVIIVSIRPDGSLVETWMHMDGWQIVWESTVDVPGSPAAGEPSLAVSPSGTSVSLVYKGTDNVVRYRSRTTATWRPEEVVTVGSAPLQIHPNASPGLAVTGLPIGMVVNAESLVLAASDALGYLKLYTLNAFPRRWTALPIPYESMRSGIGRPSMAWTGTPPVLTNSALSVTPSILNDGGALSGTSPVLASGAAPSGTPITVGRFYIVFLESNPPVGNTTNPNPVRMAMSYVDENGTYRIGLNSYFDNVWSYAFGIDLLQPNEVGLRAAVAYAIPNAGSHPDSFGMVTFRPHADGIANLLYSNKNDWTVLAWGSCSVLSAVQPAAMKTACSPKPF